MSLSLRVESSNIFDPLDIYICHNNPGIGGGGVKMLGKLTFSEDFRQNSRQHNILATIVSGMAARAPSAINDNRMMLG